jgi:8-oxo-dGTP pyrophosphatase MutT (NUDIX family)
MQTVSVVSAAIIQNGRILLAQRGPGSHAWKWCTPGGKVNDGETNDEALRRELVEELGPNALIGSYGARAYTHHGQMTTQNRTFVLRCYVVNPMAGASFIPQPTEKIVGVGWFSAEELATLPLAPADEAHREELVKLVRGD